MSKIYKCDRCSKTYKHKNDYKRHINRKTKCESKVKLGKDQDGFSKDQDLSNNSYPNDVSSENDITYDFKCEECNIMFSNKSNLMRHKRKVCNIQDINNDNKMICPYCDKDFYRHCNFNSHKQKCAKRGENQILLDSYKKRYDDVRSLIEKCEDPIEKLKLIDILTLIMDLKSKINSNDTQIVIKEVKDTLKNDISVNTNSNNVGQIQNSNNNNNNISHIQNNNIMIGFGNENLYSLLTDEEALKYLKCGYQSVIKLIDGVHFNNERPQYQNVYISNKKEKMALTFDGNKWIACPEDDAVDQLFDDAQTYLTEMYKELKDKMDEKSRKKFDKFNDDCNKECAENIKKNIKQNLYNNRDIVITTRNQKKKPKLIKQ